MRLMKFVAATLLSMSVMGAAHSANISLSPTDNYTVAIVDDWDHPFQVWADGTYGGDTNWGSFSIVDRFQLPAFTAGTNVTSADYVLHATSAPEGSFPHSVYLTSNTWQASDVDSGILPQPQGAPLRSFQIGSGQDMHIDLTSAVNAAYHGDGIITILIANSDYHYNGQDFDKDKSLNLTISAVPEPETYAMMLAGLGIMGMLARRRKTRS